MVIQLFSNDTPDGMKKKLDALKTRRKRIDWLKVRGKVTFEGDAVDIVRALRDDDR